MHALIRGRPTGWGTLALLTLLAASSGAAPPARVGVALVPLDDRPVCLQLPVMLGEVADTDVPTPPRAILGRFLKTGDGDALARWLDAVDLDTLDAVVVSTDMLAYGGLAGSRVPRVFEVDARRRLDALTRLKQRRADLRVYAFSTILEPAPPAEADNDARRQTSARNLAINLSLVERAATGAIDYLVFSHATAVDEEHRTAIADAIVKAGVANRVVIQPGADTVAMVGVLIVAPLPRHCTWTRKEKVSDVGGTSTKPATV